MKFLIKDDLKFLQKFEKFFWVHNGHEYSYIL